MSVAINQYGHFTSRPEIGAIYRTNNGLHCEVASTWQGGVVFTGGPIVFADEFINQYQAITTKPIQGELL